MTQTTVRVRVVCALALLLAAVTAVAAPDRLEVRSIRLAHEGADTRVDLRLSHTARFELFTLTGPDRVVLDIRSAALGKSALPLPGPAGDVRGIRVAHRPGGHLRIVFDVAGPMQPRGTGGVDGGPTLSISLRPAGLAVTDDAPARANAPDKGAGALSQTRPVTDAELHSGGVVAPARPRADTAAGALRGVVIAVDAGHGGHDPGARGPGGALEKDVTLAISRRLVKLINQQPGARGVLTRSGDQFVVLRQRMERARSANADLFVSIHADAALNRGARGSTVYVLSEKGATDEAARRLAARENAALIGGVELGDKDPVLASVLMDLSQNASISSSIDVGSQILGELGRLGRLHRQTVQQAPFMVLKSPDVPSVLVETAYISNPQDEKALRSPDHQERLARAILAGIHRYFENNPPQRTLLAARPAQREDAIRHVIRRGDTLSGLASQYRISVQRIRSANDLAGDRVRIGQVLHIPREST